MAKRKEDEVKDVKGASAEGDAGAEQVQAAMDKIQEQGFQGFRVDPTPDAHYTIAGVIGDKPTPENDAKAAEKAQGAVGVGGTKFEAGEQA